MIYNVYYYIESGNITSPIYTKLRNKCCLQIEYWIGRILYTENVSILMHKKKLEEIKVSECNVKVYERKFKNGFDLVENYMWVL